MKKLILIIIVFFVANAGFTQDFKRRYATDSGIKLSINISTRPVYHGSYEIFVYQKSVFITEVKGVTSQELSAHGYELPYKVNDCYFQAKGEAYNGLVDEIIHFPYKANFSTTENVQRGAHGVGEVMFTQQAKDDFEKVRKSKGYNHWTKHGLVRYINVFDVRAATFHEINYAVKKIKEAKEKGKKAKQKAQQLISEVKNNYKSADIAGIDAMLSKLSQAESLTENQSVMSEISNLKSALNSHKEKLEKENEVTTKEENNNTSSKTSLKNNKDNLSDEPVSNNYNNNNYNRPKTKQYQTPKKSTYTQLLETQKKEREKAQHLADFTNSASEITAGIIMSGKSKNFDNYYYSLTELNSDTDNPAELIRSFTSQINKLKKLMAQERKRNAANFNKQLNEVNRLIKSAKTKSEGIAGAITAGVAVTNLIVRQKALKNKQKEAEVALEYQLKEKVTSIKNKLVAKHTKNTTKFYNGAIKAIAKQNEDYYWAMYKYSACVVNYINRNFNYKSTRWLNYSCTQPRRTNARINRNQTAEDLYNASVRKKYNKNKGFSKSSNTLIDMAISKNPNNAKYYFYKASYFKLGTKKNIAYLKKTVELNSNYKKADDYLTYSIALYYNTEQSYYNYIKKYKNGKFYPTVKRKYDELVKYNKEIYLTNSFQSKKMYNEAANHYLTVSKTRLFKAKDIKELYKIKEFIVYRTAKNNRTYKSISEYINTYPSGKYKNEVELILYNKISMLRGMSDCEQYLSLYKNGKHLQEIEELYYQAAIKINSIKAFRRYMKNTHIRTYKPKIEKAYYKIVKAKDDFYVYESFVEVFYKGDMVNEAQEYLNSNYIKMAEDNEKLKTKEGNEEAIRLYNAYIENNPVGAKQKMAKRKVQKIQKRINFDQFSGAFVSWPFSKYADFGMTIGTLGPKIGYYGRFAVPFFRALGDNAYGTSGFKINREGNLINEDDDAAFGLSNEDYVYNGIYAFGGITYPIIRYVWAYAGAGLGYYRRYDPYYVEGGYKSSLEYKRIVNYEKSGLKIPIEIGIMVTVGKKFFIQFGISKAKGVPTTIEFGIGFNM